MPFIVMDSGSRIIGNDTEEFIIKRQERLASMLIALAAAQGGAVFCEIFKRLWAGLDKLDLDPEPVAEPDKPA